MCMDIFGNKLLTYLLTIIMLRVPLSHNVETFMASQVNANLQSTTCSVPI